MILYLNLVIYEISDCPWSCVSRVYVGLFRSRISASYHCTKFFFTRSFSFFSTITTAFMPAFLLDSIRSLCSNRISYVFQVEDSLFLRLNVRQRLRKQSWRKKNCHKICWVAVGGRQQNRQPVTSWVCLLCLSNAYQNWVTFAWWFCSSAFHFNFVTPSVLGLAKVI
jgi:hypothetical protein